MEARDRWHLAQDSALAAIVASMGIAEVWVPFESVEGTGSPIVSSVVILVSAALIALRRTRTGLLAVVPLAWIIATVASDGHPQVLFFGGLVPLMLVLYSGVRHGTVRVAAMVCGSVLATILLGDLFIPELQEPSEILFHWGVTIAVFLVGFGLRLSERRAVDAALRAAAAEAEAEQASLRAVAEERTRIARELHDILGHSLSVMVVQAGAAAQVVDEDPETARRALEAIRATGSDALAEIRRVVSLLREDRPDLSPQPGITRIPELIEQARADGLQVEYTVDDDAFELSAGRQLVVYRVVQESLTNIRRHTRATAANVSVRCRDGEVLVTVTDDGHTRLDATATTGHGLLGMRERVALYGGTLETGQEQGGWRVHAVVPVGVLS